MPDDDEGVPDDGIERFGLPVGERVQGCERRRPEKQINMSRFDHRTLRNAARGAAIAADDAGARGDRHTLRVMLIRMQELLLEALRRGLSEG